MGREPQLQFSSRLSPNPEYKPLKTFLVWLLFFTVLLVLVWILYPDDAGASEPTGTAADAQEDPQLEFADELQVERWIRHFLRGVRKGKRWKAAGELAELITEHAAAPEAYWSAAPRRSELIPLGPIDPLLVAVNFSLESSFYSAGPRSVGKSAGELGIAQIHPLNKRALTRPDGTLYDMKQRAQQVAAGVRELAYQVQRCPSLEAALSAYKYGGCSPVHGVGPYRAKIYRKARKVVGLPAPK